MRHCPARHREPGRPRRVLRDRGRDRRRQEMGRALARPAAGAARKLDRCLLDGVSSRIYILRSISGSLIVRVSKWGNSLAIRLPGSVVQALELKEGDEIEVHVAGERAFDIARDRSRERALARIRAFRKELPADWKFDREEANAR